MRTRILVSTIALIVLAGVAFGFAFGDGHVRAWQSDNTTTIHYSVTESDGTGTPGFTCEIKTPSGRTIVLTQTSSAWNESESHAYFNHAGRERGIYRVTCYWNIRNSGRMNGPHAVASATFER